MWGRPTGNAAKIERMTLRDGDHVVGSPGSSLFNKVNLFLLSSFVFALPTLTWAFVIGSQNSPGKQASSLLCPPKICFPPSKQSQDRGLCLMGSPTKVLIPIGAIISSPCGQWVKGSLPCAREPRPGERSLETVFEVSRNVC